MWVPCIDFWMMSASVSHDRGALISTGERDYNHATDNEYQRLRTLAEQAYQKRQQLSQESQAAFKNGDGAKAHQLSEKAKVKQKLAEQYNFEAAEYVFVQNNADSGSNEIDLHGLYVKEALWILKKRVMNGIRTNEPHLRVIVGKGLHSQSGVAKIKPAVEQLCQEANLRDSVDKKNAGVLIIELQGARIPQEWEDAENNSNVQYGNNQQNHQQQQAIPSAHFTGGYQPQQQPQYQPQQQQQQYYSQQQGNSNSDGDLLVKLLKFVCVCIQKNI